MNEIIWIFGGFCVDFRFVEEKINEDL